MEVELYTKYSYPLESLKVTKEVASYSIEKTLNKNKNDLKI